MSPPFRLAGVIGWPVFQSRSPLVHGAWLAQHGIAGAYLPLAVAPGGLPDALRGLRALGFAGANVTVPHKQEAARLVDRLDEAARRMDAVNLVVVEADGTLSGRNTDGYGFREALREAQPGLRLDGAPVCVIGAGGGARAVVGTLLDEGAPEIRVCNRNFARARELAALFGEPRVRVVEWHARHEALAGCGLLVNTTKAGMIGEPALNLDLRALPLDAVVCDIVYNPLEPPLLAAARARGNPAVNGLGMLLHQARPAFQAWFGVLPDVTPGLRTAVEATLG